MFRGGACIVREAFCPRALLPEAETLALGFKPLSSATIDPDILVTVAGKPHAFMYLAASPEAPDHAYDGRIEALQRNFKHLYLLVPASLHGVGRTVGIATRFPTVEVVSLVPDSSPVEAVGAACRLVHALCGDDSCGDELIAPGPEEVQRQREMFVTMDASVEATLHAAAELE